MKTYYLFQAGGAPELQAVTDDPASDKLPRARVCGVAHVLPGRRCRWSAGDLVAEALPLVNPHHTCPAPSDFPFRQSGPCAAS